MVQIVNKHEYPDRDMQVTNFESLFHVHQIGKNFKNLIISSVWGDVEQRKLAYLAGGSVNWCNHFGQQFGKVKMCVLFSPLVGSCPPNSDMYLRRYIQAFTIALFVRVKKWKQLKCPSMGEWIKKWWYIHTMEFYAAVKMMTMLSEKASCRMICMVWCDLYNVKICKMTNIS